MKMFKVGDKVKRCEGTGENSGLTGIVTEYSGNENDIAIKWDTTPKSNRYNHWDQRKFELCYTDEDKEEALLKIQNILKESNRGFADKKKSKFTKYSLGLVKRSDGSFKIINPGGNDKLDFTAEECKELIDFITGDSNGA